MSSLMAANLCIKSREIASKFIDAPGQDCRIGQVLPALRLRKCRILDLLHAADFAVVFEIGIWEGTQNFREFNLPVESRKFPRLSHSLQSRARQSYEASQPAQ